MAILNEYQINKMGNKFSRGDARLNGFCLDEGTLYAIVDDLEECATHHILLGYQEDRGSVACEHALHRLLGELARVDGGWTAGRIHKLWSVIDFMPYSDLKKARVVTCADESSGRRFGEADKRRGRCKKLGGGGRRTGSWAYQVWLDWS